MRRAPVSGWKTLGFQLSFSENNLVLSSAPGGAGSMGSLVGVIVGLQWLHLSLEHGHSLLRISGEPLLQCEVWLLPLSLCLQASDFLVRTLR